MDQNVGKGEIHSKFIAETCCKVSFGTVEYHNNIKRSVFRKLIKSNPITGLDRPIEFQAVEAPRFQDNRHMKVVRLSALRTYALRHSGL
jgi:hypothetical protein